MKTVNDIITRDIEKPLEHWLFKKKVLILYGARQVGKTTVAQSLLKRFGKPEDYEKSSKNKIHSSYVNILNSRHCSFLMKRNRCVVSVKH